MSTRDLPGWNIVDRRRVGGLASTPRGVRAPAAPLGRGVAWPTGNPKRRLLAALAAFVLLFAVVGGRLVQLQILGSERYVALGESQRLKPITLPGDRGSVFDRNGHDLAMSVRQQTVYANPRMVPDPVGAAAKLAPLIGADPDVLANKLNLNVAFQYVARQVPDDVAKAIEKLAIPGIFFIDEPKRFNPAGDLARSVVGRVNLDGVGSAGLELQYDKLLTGEPGQLIMERDPSGRTIPAGEHRLDPAQRGDDLVLTIDRSMQFHTEQALARQVDAMGAKGGIALVSDPKTGEILALANVEKPTDGSPARPSGNNMALTTVFEPGSANKLITMAGAIEEGLAEPSTVMSVPDHLTMYDKTFRDHDPHPVEQWSLTDIMATSSNIGTIMLGQQLGKDRIDSYLRRFGFGSRSGLEFPNESAGILLAPDKWSGTSLGAIAIGQGVAVTAVQMLQAFNVVANGGVAVPPKLVRETVDREGRHQPVTSARPQRVISAKTATELRDMLTEVVRVGTGEKAAIDGYTVAGKTGTARKPLPQGGYQDAAGNFHYVTTFAGFVPAEDPQLSIIVVLDEPTSSIYASEASAPVFADLASYALRLFRIPPPAVAVRSTVPQATVDGDAARNELPGGRVQQAPANTSTTSTTAANATSRSRTDTSSSSGAGKSGDR